MGAREEEEEEEKERAKKKKCKALSHKGRGVKVGSQSEKRLTERIQVA